MSSADPFPSRPNGPSTLSDPLVSPRRPPGTPSRSPTGVKNNPSSPPRSLGAAGQDLWDRILNEYRIDDAVGVEILTLACEALDRAEFLKKEINDNGVNGSLVKDEFANRNFVIRALIKLGIVEREVLPVGRPTANLGWTDDVED
jgi:hypothetical protein